MTDRTKDESLESSAEHSWNEEYGEQVEAGPEEDSLDRAWDLLDAGDPHKALDELLQLDPDWPERWIPEALARTQLGELQSARRLLERTSEFTEIDDHADYLWAKADLDLAEWRVEDARATLQKLVRVEKSPGALGRLALCEELDGNFEKADALLEEALALEPDPVPIPRFSPKVFEDVVAEAVETLSPETKKALERCEIAIEPVPAIWMVDTSDLSGTPPDMLGLFAGASELERSEYETAALPPRIFLFQRNLERACRTHAELLEQIRVTLFHEIGHMLGFDEHGVAELGLE